MTTSEERPVPQQVPVRGRVKRVIEVDGLRFKDLDGDGALTPYEDWRLSPAERAADLVSRMTPEEEIGDAPSGAEEAHAEGRPHVDVDTEGSC